MIRSPEQVALDLEIAGPMSRALAFSVDYGLILIMETLVLIALIFAALTAATVMELEQVGQWFEEVQSDLADGGGFARQWVFAAIGIWLVVEFVIQWGYFVVCELLMQGRSPGKAMFGLRVVRDGGLPIGFRESMLRNLLRVVDMLPSGYFIGFLSMAVSRDTKRLGDYGAGTVVVREAKAGRARPLDLDRSPAPGAPAFRFDHEQLAAVGPVELQLIRQTLRRVEDVHAWQAKKILERTVEALRRRLAVEEEVAEIDRKAFLMALLKDTDRR